MAIAKMRTMPFKPRSGRRRAWIYILALAIAGPVLLYIESQLTDKFPWYNTALISVALIVWVVALVKVPKDK